MKTLKLLGLALAAASALTASVQAVAINGTILFLGSGSVTTSGGTTTFNPANPWVTVGTLGDYTAVPIGTLVTKSPISYTGTGTGATLVGSVSPEWTFSIGTTLYSFDLTSLTSGVTVIGPPSSIALSGSGVAHIDGFADTAASWSMSGTSDGVTFSLGTQSTTALGTAVPDGGATIALLGVGLLGLGALRRKL